MGFVVAADTKLPPAGGVGESRQQKEEEVVLDHTKEVQSALRVCVRRSCTDADPCTDEFTL